MYSNILVRFAELSTKGKNKMTFVRKLAKNIELLAGAKPTVTFDRIFLDYSEETMKNLQYVFGIYSYSPVVKVETDLAKIEEVVNTLVPKCQGSTFKVATKRNFKGFQMTSDEMNNHIGGMVLRNFPNLKVNVKTPDIKVEIEIREKFTYVFAERVKGLGGYPTGINGKVLHLMSGGIDSPVAAYELMKRGLRVDFLNFVTPPFTDQRTIDKVDRLIKMLVKYQGETTVYRSNYTDIMNLIGLTSNQSYKINLMRRSFYRIATSLAHINKYHALSNGENIGQVASQTLESIRTIASQSDLPIFRPILTADKLETIEKSIKIGLYNLSIEKCYETCELFAPKAPVTKPVSWEAERLEAELVGLKELERENIKHNIDIFKISIKD